MKYDFLTAEHGHEMRSFKSYIFIHCLSFLTINDSWSKQCITKERKAKCVWSLCKAYVVFLLTKLTLSVSYNTWSENIVYCQYVEIYEVILPLLEALKVICFMTWQVSLEWKPFRNILLRHMFHTVASMISTVDKA